MSIQDLVLYDESSGGIQSGVTAYAWENNDSYSWSSRETSTMSELTWTIGRNALGTLIWHQIAYKLLPNVDISQYYKVNVIVSSKTGPSSAPYSGSVLMQSKEEFPEKGGYMVVGTNEFVISEIMGEGTGAILLYPEEPIGLPVDYGSNTVEIKIDKVWLSGPEDDPPSKPNSITYPLSIKAGSNVTIDWDASEDPNGDLAGYIVERSINNGAAWNQVYDGISNSCKNLVESGISKVMYRVKAYDTYPMYSDYTVGSIANVIPNTSPTTPPSITVPLNISAGAEITISWGASSDAESDEIQYKLERSIDGKTTWALVAITESNKRYYTGIVGSDWTQVAYRVCAIEKESGVSSEYRISDNRTITQNDPPVVDIDEIIGIKTTAFSATYTVTAEATGTISIREKIDGIIVATKAGVSPISESVDVNNNIFRKLTNGQHSVVIEATDSAGLKTIGTATFNKKISKLIIEPSEPIMPEVSGDRIDICMITVTGNIPSDAALTVQVSNNAKDTTPVWEILSTAEKTGANHVFTNTTAEKGFAFSFKITAEEGPSEEGGYITSVQGGFQKAE